MNKLIFLLIATIFWVSAAYSKNHQAPHTEPITLFASPNIYSKAITKLPANSKVNVLGTDMGTGFAYIRTQNQQQGWIKMQHLQAMSAVNELVPVTPIQETPKSKVHFTSWLKQKWDSAKLTLESKKKQLTIDQHRLIDAAIIFAIGLFVGLFLAKKPRNRPKTEFIWRGNC